MKLVGYRLGVKKVIHTDSELKMMQFAELMDTVEYVHGG